MLSLDLIGRKHPSSIKCTGIRNFYLEWLKLFGSDNEEHHWENIIGDSDEFKENMFKNSEINEDMFSECRKSFKEYRDKFVAHLDSEEVMQIPQLDIAITAAKFYYGYVASELGKDNLGRLPEDIDSYYKQCFEDSEEYFAK